MEIGYQTILFGHKISNIDAVLQTIAEAGFTGVEFCQPPDLIHVYDKKKDESRSVTMMELARLMHRHGLSFLGIAGDSLEKRVKFCLSADRAALERERIEAKYYHPLYLYMDSYDEAALKRATDSGFAIAAHPHVYMECDSIAGTRRLFGNRLDETGSPLFWLPDTAHMYIAGEMMEDGNNGLKSLTASRIIAVHIKDWDEAFGRSYHRYARGFRNLGDGDVPLITALEILKGMGYDGWLVVEQDYPKRTKAEEVLHAAKWCHQLTLLRKQPPDRLSQSLPSEDRYEQQREKWATQNADALQKILRSGTHRPTECYEVIVNSLESVFGACLVTLWTYTRTRQEMSLLAAAPPGVNKQPEISLVQRKKTLLDRVGQSLRPELFTREQIEQYAREDKFQWYEVFRDSGAEAVLAIPILNRFNFHHVRFIAAIFLPRAPMQFWGKAIALAEGMVIAADYSLDDECAYTIGKVNHLADQTAQLSDYLEKLKNLIHQSLDCEGVTIFLENRTGERLEKRATTGIRWRSGLQKQERAYTPMDLEQYTTQCWTERKIILVADTRIRELGGDNHEYLSTESGPQVTEDRHNILVVPIFYQVAGRRSEPVAHVSDQLSESTARVIGVVRCRNKKWTDEALSQQHLRYFTDDDAAVLDGICQAASAQIELLRNEELRVRAMARIVHELTMPLSALRATTEALDIEVSSLIPDHRKRYKYDYIGDIYSQTDLMARVTGNAEIYGLKFGDLVLAPEPTLLMGEVIGPAVTQTRFLLQNRQFKPYQIWYSDFREIPGLYVDKGLFQQVFFNLLSNAIKYAFKAPDQFRVEIEGERRDGWYHIYFRDWGPGIDDAFKEVIFTEGERGPTYLNVMVKGLGIGLWVVRRIIEAHGGHVELTHNGQPTEITIYLPDALRSGPPSRKPRKSTSQNKAES